MLPAGDGFRPPQHVSREGKKQRVKSYQISILDFLLFILLVFILKEERNPC